MAECLNFGTAMIDEIQALHWSKLHEYSGIMNQFAQSCVPYRVRKLAQALITLGSPSAQSTCFGFSLDRTSVLSHQFCQVLTTMLREPKQVPKEPKVDTFQKHTQCFAYSVSCFNIDALKESTILPSINPFLCHGSAVI